MPLYKEVSYNDVSNLLNNLRTTPTQNTQVYGMIGQKAGVQAAQQKGGLEGFLGGLGQTIGNVGISLAGLIGGGVAGFGGAEPADIAVITGKHDGLKL